MVVGAEGLHGRVVGRGGGGGYSSDAHICSLHQTPERTHAASLIHLPTPATQMSPQLGGGAADATLQPFATLNLVPTVGVC